MSLDSIPCDLFVDISGSDCNLPSSKLHDAIEVLLPGQSLMAVSAKHTLVSDVPTFCRQHSLELVERGDMDDMFYFLIRQL
jgi:TusA-related sulfurtransferase